MAKKTKAVIEAERIEKLNQVVEIIDSVNTRAADMRKSFKQLSLLESVSKGLYEEVDKLCKKAPAESITDLILTQINDVIKETKELITEDTYVQRLNVFVPAGDNPEQRDVLVVLRQLRQGLERYEQRLLSIDHEVKEATNEWRFIETALEIFLEQGRIANRQEFNKYDIRVGSTWLTGNYPYFFNFEKLDNTDLRSYFAENE